MYVTVHSFTPKFFLRETSFYLKYVRLLQDNTFKIIQVLLSYWRIHNEYLSVSEVLTGSLVVTPLI